jgi:hypothetical protein
MRSPLAAALIGAAFLAACAGRDPQQIATVQATDANATCPMIKAEIEANNVRMSDLAAERGWKIGQNVVAGVGGVVFFPFFFAMDMKGAAVTEADALQARQQYLAALANEKCGQRR